MESPENAPTSSAADEGQVREHVITLLRRDFPMMLNEKDAAQLREAAKLIEARIEKYRSSYNIADEVILALMTCLDLAHEQVRQRERSHNESSDTRQRLEAIDALLGEYLAK